MTQNPDIIVIVTDQQRYDTIRALGPGHMETPNIDRLVGPGGASFANCHVTAPSCAAARGIPQARRSPGSSGRLHLGPVGEAADNFVGETAKWWLETKPVEKPLFLVGGFPGPHPPYDPTPEMAEKYMGREVPVPLVAQEKLDALPPALVEKRQHDVEVDHDSVAWKVDPTEEELRRMWAYYANVEMIDTQVGHILDALQKRGRMDNTIIVFTSDHGDCLGDHGLIQKWAPYDEVTRVPLTICAPQRFNERRGGRDGSALRPRADDP